MTALPVSADVEAGYSADPQRVAETVSAVIDAGAVGINLEDGSASPGAARREDQRRETGGAARPAWTCS